ncbi:MAG: lipoprotein localization factor LolB, partial [Stenotrophomonas chelatiphaga]
YPAQDGRQSLPRRIEASKGDAKVRLVVDQWGAANP